MSTPPSQVFLVAPARVLCLHLRARCYLPTAASPASSTRFSQSRSDGRVIVPPLCEGIAELRCLMRGESHKFFRFFTVPSRASGGQMPRRVVSSPRA